jgi:hypothetical protein
MSTVSGTGTSEEERASRASVPYRCLCADLGDSVCLQYHDRVAVLEVSTRLAIVTDVSERVEL